ncbi:unnamed protein product [Rotaria magnacalcarata]|uniref:G-protein coupled receptors family 1 profile domain-containing protein n=1 Tax=Rotaria magnacalcarata TaxID=392030 RepID=A0A814FYZ9_9BILA|nr:unnamed protein product [Rotaria magnacalcarata]CAF3789836.1 unnamed protein product [Rotaria magnacalcarata]CAF3804419.1 unnamed protein product [Rotaria magnacalcarata]CAF5207782.1 unnamed protein product [Rotaria magnacalcarata]
MLSKQCLTAATCVCPQCYLSTGCQLSTRSFGLPLDVILGYQIRPKFLFSRQPSSLIISGIVTVIMFVLGLVNGTLSFISFRGKSIRAVSCGVYLFAASIISVFTMTIFAVKYFFLVVTQLTMIENRTFLLVQCLLLDFFLRILVQIEGWLYACVAIEHLITIMKRANFNKNSTRQVTKYIILLVCMIVASTSIHEPLNRS